MRTNDNSRVVNRSDLLPLAAERAGSAGRKFDGAQLCEQLAQRSVLEGPLHQGTQLEDSEWCLSLHGNHGLRLHSGAGVHMARVAQFILGQTNRQECVPCLINLGNVS